MIRLIKMRFSNTLMWVKLMHFLVKKFLNFLINFRRKITEINVFAIKSSHSFDMKSRGFYLGITLINFIEKNIQFNEKNET